ncbi:hypothetical protein Hanom_Chr15g01397311 [Helianthus anomalus]
MPPPVFATTPPTPSTAAASPPSTVVIILPQSVVAPPQKPTTPLVTPSTTSFLSTTMPKPTPSLREAAIPFSRSKSKSPIYPNALMVSIVKPPPCDWNIWSSPVNPGSPFKDTYLQNEWKPPWCIVTTYSYATGRPEWRPPWIFTRIVSRFLTLWTRLLEVGGNDVCHETHEVVHHAFILV